MQDGDAVKFAIITADKFNALEEKDPACVYFIIKDEIEDEIEDE